MLTLVKIESDCMSPKLKPGDFVIASKLNFVSKYIPIKPGDILIIEHPIFKRLVKEVINVIDGCYLVTGINEESVLQTAWVKPHQILAKVMLRLKI